MTVPVSKAFAATLVVGWALAVGCGSRNLPLMKPASGGAGESGQAGAGSAGSSTSGSAGAAGRTVTGLAGNGGAGTAGASVGGAGSTAGAAGSTAGAAGSTAGSGGAGGAAGFKGILGEGGSDGGAPDCKDPCPALTCAGGSAPMPDPLQPCCPLCKSVKCAGTSCPEQSCLPGHHPELGPNQCCSVCVVDANVCDEAVAEFTQLVGSLRDQLGGPCQLDVDCTYTSWNNGCSANCFVPVTKAGAAMFDAALRDSTTICNTICETPQPISCPHMTAVCAQGRCAAKP